MNKPGSSSVDEYISSFPQEVQSCLGLLRQTIREIVPEAGETIKYGMPTYTLNGNLVYFAAFKKHIGLFGIPNNHEKFKERTAVYKSGKGSIQFPLDQPLPLELIRDLVQYRADENRAKENAARVSS